MKKSFRSICTFFSLIVVFTAIGSQELTGHLVWKKINRIIYYRVQIKNKIDNKIVVNKVVNANYLKIDLPLGAYLSRTAALNRFKKPITWSYWRNLTISKAVSPILLSSSVKQTGDQVQLKLGGKNFNDQTQIILEGEGGDRHILKNSRTSTSEDNISVLIPVEQLKAQRYHLVLLNPATQPKRIQNIIEITDQGEVKSTFHLNKNEGEAVATKNNNNENKIDESKLYRLTKQESQELKIYQNYVDKLPRNCSNSTLPEILIKECFQYYVKLNLDSRSNKNLYYFINLESKNSEDRWLAYQYFQENCTKTYKNALYFMKSKWTNRKSLIYNEKQKLKTTIDKQKECF